MAFTNRRVIPFLLCLLPFSASGETLLGVYELAQKNDHQLQADIAKYEAGIQVENINRSDLLPQITGDARYTETDSSLDSNTSTDSAAYGLTLRQSIYNASVLNSHRQGKIQAESAKMQLHADQQSLIIRVAEAYFNVLSALDQQGNAKSEQKALATRLEQTRQRYEVGLISINDVHEAQAGYDSAVADALVAETQVGVNIEALTTITGQYPVTIAPLKASFKAIAPVPADKQAWIDFAMSNNLQLKIQELAVDNAVYNTKISKGNSHPTLDGTLRHEQNDDITGDDGDYYQNSINLNLSLPIYTGGRNSALRKQAGQQQIQAEQELLLAQRNILQETRSLYLTVVTDIPQIKARQQAIISSQSALDAAQAGYEAGTRDIVDTVNAERNLFQAQRNYSTALYTHIINTLKLKQVAGQLDEEDLASLESWLDNTQAIAITP